MTVYTQQIATAKRLIAEKGQAVTVERKTVTGYDPVAGEPTTTTQMWSTQAVILPMDSGSLQRWSNAFADGTLTRQKARLALLPAYGAETLPGDTITDAAGDTWNVHGNDAIAPDGPVILNQVVMQR